jgi:hypothetical protein
LDARALIARTATIQVLGGSLERLTQIEGAWQQDEAENQIAGGQIDRFRRKVNGPAQPLSRINGFVILRFMNW